jgi:long-subunit acyl-CoA synthetase (AMP-forming)
MHDICNIIGANIYYRAEWMLTALACLSLGIVITTAYDSMPADAVSHIIKETGAKGIFTEVTSYMTSIAKN